MLSIRVPISFFSLLAAFLLPHLSTSAAPPPEENPFLPIENMLPGIGSLEHPYRANLCPTIMSLGNDVADTAREHLGVRYKKGGASPAYGFDCSGFVHWVFSKQGISIPRNTIQQSRVGQEVSKDKLLPGDILIFRIANTPNGRHSGIYLGEGSFIHSPAAGSHVRIEKLNSSYWKKHYLTARRVLEEPVCDIPFFNQPEPLE